MLLTSIIEFLFPRICIVCNNRLDTEEHILCTQCKESLPLTNWWKNEDYNKLYRPDDKLFKEIRDKSQIKDLPTKTTKDKKELFEENPLAKKYWGRCNINKAMAFMKFAPKTNISKIVYSFKYNKRDDVARYMGELMGKHLNEFGFFEGIDCIVPVPITFMREKSRGYNQSLELAIGLNRNTGITIVNDSLKRVKFKVSQTKISGVERKENIEGAFKLTDYSYILKNKHILLIDDVITTGSTTLECCKELQKIQGTKISILSLGIATI